jgi:hypothetical protein
LTALDRAQTLFAAWKDEILADLPPNAEIFDAHVHLGQDIDGMAGRLDELLGMMDEYGVGRAFMFCLDEPDTPRSALQTTGRSSSQSVRRGG